ncbi:RDD family protein [Massilia sp. IC2-278]|uniref:RDD family protein n=1 Tax=Massilia sp. IC2-278 TaxID=2887200 RepID=UPI001E2E53B5|nr:RDD family protein [Massilia sp. IC2-278]MCC2961901.1 RDD family protein [Massilia sp. IC2-278]
MTPADSDLVYAGFWQRFGASFLDGVLIYLVLIIFLLVVYGTGGIGDPEAYPGIASMLVLYALPPALIMTFWIKKSATPGKMAIAAIIVDARTGGKPTTKQFLIRYLGYGLSTLPCFLGYLWVVFDARKQSWHDKLADTVVVRRKAGMSEQVRFEKPLNEPAG